MPGFPCVGAAHGLALADNLAADRIFKHTNRAVSPNLTANSMLSCPRCASTASNLSGGRGAHYSRPGAFRQIRC
jgi:hypothetical protein